MRDMNPTWLRWLRAAAKDTPCRVNLPGPLAMLTGQDMRALNAIAACWQLLASSDDDGRASALAAVRMLLPAMQPETRAFARELIPWAMDWSHREMYWPLVTELVTDKPL